jgi:hypothetical protein
MTLAELIAATDDERLHWLGAVLQDAKQADAFDVIADTFERVVKVNRALPKALADLETVKGDARVPAAVKTAIEAIRVELETSRTRERGLGGDRTRL